MVVRKCVVWLLIATGFPVSSWAQKGSSAAEHALYDAVNQERKSHGLRSLEWDHGLAAAARKHAQEMAKQRAVEHRFSDEPSLPSRATKAGARFISISENVVQAASAKVAHSEFMHSPNHRANILDRDVDSIGVGVAERGGQLFVVQDFSKSKK